MGSLICICGVLFCWDDTTSLCVCFSALWYILYVRGLHQRLLSRTFVLALYCLTAYRFTLNTYNKRYIALCVGDFPVVFIAWFVTSQIEHVLVLLILKIVLSVIFYMIIMWLGNSIIFKEILEYLRKGKV